MFLEERDYSSFQPLESWSSCDVWVEDKNEVWTQSIFSHRDYSVYALLAGVRNDWGIPPISEPRGLPGNISPLVAKCHSQLVGSAYGHSWLTLKDFLEVDMGMYDDFYETKNARNAHERVVSKKELINSVEYFSEIMTKASIKSSFDPFQPDQHFHLIRLERAHFGTEPIYIKRPNINRPPESIRIVFWFSP